MTAFRIYGAAADYIPPLLMSAAAEFRAALMGQQYLQRLPDWSTITEDDPRYQDHQWAAKTRPHVAPPLPSTAPSTMTAPLPPVTPPPARTTAPIAPSELDPIPVKSIILLESPAAAGPSRTPLAKKRLAMCSPSPPRKSKKRTRFTSLKSGAKRSMVKSVEVLTDTGSEAEARRAAKLPTIVIKVCVLHCNKVKLTLCSHYRSRNRLLVRYVLLICQVFHKLTLYSRSPLSSRLQSSPKSSPTLRWTMDMKISWMKKMRTM